MVLPLEVVEKSGRQETSGFGRGPLGKSGRGGEGGVMGGLCERFAPPGVEERTLE
jgi:hypothetical protein